MARKVPGRTPGQIVTFVPAVLGNERDPEPVTFGFQEPTERERRELDALAAARALEAGDEPSIEVQAKLLLSWSSDYIEKFLLWVKNYTSAGRDGEAVAIVDAKTLLQHGEAPFIGALANCIRSKLGLDEEEKKISGEPSGSSHPDIHPSSGTAAIAASKVSAECADAA